MRNNKSSFSQLKMSLREKKRLKDKLRNKTLEHQESLQKVT